MKPKPPLREKRRQASRKAFLDAAAALFKEQGIQNTTMTQIASESGLHVQTLYSHFPTKQTLVSVVAGERFRVAFDQRDHDTISFWRTWVLQATRDVIAGNRAKDLLDYASHDASDPRMAGTRAIIGAGYMKLLANGITGDLGIDREGTSHLPVLIANMLWGANAEVLRRWSFSGGVGDLIELHTQAIDEVAAVVSHLVDNDFLRR